MLNEPSATARKREYQITTGRGDLDPCHIQAINSLSGLVREESQELDLEREEEIWRLWLAKETEQGQGQCLQSHEVNTKTKRFQPSS